MKLLVLHGFTQNGDVLRAHLSQLLTELPSDVTCLFPNAPHTCSEESLKRLRGMLGAVQAPPHLCWWNATDDGLLYRGFEQSLATLQSSVAGGETFGVLGFSQGAVFGAALAALAERGEFTRPSFVALVAGRIPRAAALKPLFETELTVPSLHVWGERDVMARAEAPKLVERFTSDTREAVHWDGPHILPTFGPAADAIVAFIRKHSCV